MSQTEQHCACNHPELVMLPVRGFGLAVDPSGLVPAPGPAPVCRERVDQDMHIYINGNLQTSGDGLSPQTAVKSFEDGVLALSRYDGCNLHAAHLHFLPLEDQLASYPDIGIYPGTLRHVHHFSSSGDSHESTRLAGARVSGLSHAFVGGRLPDACAIFLPSFSFGTMSPLNPEKRNTPS